jgi:16S rRNA (adenine1518-N6/adenine1519-N6)-dimethyltransferase
MVEAKKRYGQNFLKDTSVLNKIIEAMPKTDNVVVEIGPGLGDLTKLLVKYKDVIAYEVDKDLYNILNKNFVKQIQDSKLNIINIDVFEAWRESLYYGKYDLIANLPYYIATNIILKAIDDTNCENILVMVQKEVAQKFASKVGEKSYSSLGVICDLVSHETKKLFDVPPEAFEPAPKVYSSILYIRKNKRVISNGFKNFLKIAFLQPRKMLLKNLSSRYDKELLKNIFDTLKISTSLRPHELEASLYNLLYERIEEDEKRATDSIATKSK